MEDVNPLELELFDAESEIVGKLLETFGGASASWGGNRAWFSFWISEFRNLGMMMSGEHHSWLYG